MAPPAPPAPNAGMPAPSNEVIETGNLVAPAIPGDSALNDIKNQVTGNVPVPMEQPMMEAIQMPAVVEEPKIDDSLFDLSDLELPEPTNNEALEVPTAEDFVDSTIDTNIEREGDLSFISNKKNHRPSHSKEETFYITTSQFKSLLEIIESVKSKVKDASETHLRLMDIKSEEDIEYENLRKTFQYIEDKLYEIDSLIFDK